MNKELKFIFVGKAKDFNRQNIIKKSLEHLIKKAIINVKGD